MEKNPEQGTPIGEFRKIRMAITSKAKGKSGGARVVTVNCLVEEKEGEVFLVTIYDKSHTESITKKEMKAAYNSLKK